MKKRGCIFFLLLFLFFLSLASPVQAGNSAETSCLIVRDLTGELSQSRIRELADEAQKALDKILEFWSAEARVSRFGKIIVEFDHPKGGTKYTVFHWRNEEGKKRRIVSVHGADNPQMMVQKLTHAVYPNQDKLVRNMMGIPMEIKFGNPLTLPMCGFSCDAWVLAYRERNSYIPLRELGPDQESWGMGTKNGLPFTADKARKHTAYAESGSLGAYLLRTYGAEKLKAFNKLSRQRKRPWKEVFGLTLDEIEANWLRDIRSREQGEKENISVLLRLIQEDPSDVCSAAQSLR